MTILYGIKNCDTIKKAQVWLTANNIPFEFHDYRVVGVDESLVKDFFTHLPWQEVLNKRGTTYRQLSDELKQNLTSDNAVALLVAQPAMIKRPVLLHNGQYYLAFKADQYSEIFA